MQTILGAGGPIADELARALHRDFTQDIRLVSRHPKQVNGTDELVAADLMDPASTERAVAGSAIAYLTVGLPMDSALWEEKFPTMMRNVIDACMAHGTKLVFFDNTYMYPGTPTPQIESTGFAPGGRKGRVRAEIVTMLLDAMAAGQIDALIGRAPEFYGPGKTKSWSNMLVFDRIRAGKASARAGECDDEAIADLDAGCQSGAGAARQHPRRVRADLASADRRASPHVP